MQRQLIERNLAQRGELPLPSPALVIDVRGMSDDDIIEHLEIEITDLASEMKVHNVHHWRKLTDFLSFLRIAPLRTDDIKAIRSHQNSSATPTDSSAPAEGLAEANGNTTGMPTGLTGPVDPSTLGGFASPFLEDQGSLITERKPFDIFQQQLGDLIHEISRIRNNRAIAVADLNKEGIPGRSVKDPTVRVIFLTDVEREESLFSAAAYSFYLKEYYKKLRPDAPYQQILVSTTVICLNVSSEVSPPADLICGLLWENRWDHLDSLILSEKYSRNAVFLDSAMQVYLAELLLYVLLIIPPFAIGPVTTSTDSNSLPALESTEAKTTAKGQWITLPPQTYVVGMASMEQSVRWGRRWLNYGIVVQTIDVLRNKAAEEEQEQGRIKSTVANWLRNWRTQIKLALPDKVPGDIPALKAIPEATRAVKTADDVLPPGRLSFASFSLGERTITRLREYLTSLVKTYTVASDETEPGQQQAEDTTDEEAPTHSPTLQEAINSITLIQQRLRQWETKDPSLKKGTPLVNAQVDAQRILSHPDFFTGAQGAVPRARIQLKELGNAISNFRNKHEQNPVKLEEKREALQREGEAGINELKEHIQGWPVLASIRPLMEWLSFILVICLVILFPLLLIALIGHLINYWNNNGFSLPLPDPSVVAALAASSWFWLIVGAAFLVLLTWLARVIVNKKRKDLKVEIIFFLVLLGCALFGVALALSRQLLIGDREVAAFLLWLYVPVLWLSTIAGVFAVLLVVIEAFAFWVWYRRLLTIRSEIVAKLSNQHKQNVAAVVDFIADSIALEILQRTGLTSGDGGPGPYYTRVDQLYQRMPQIADQARSHQALAAKRLTMSLSETQLGAPTNSTGTWLNLQIRREMLDIESLTDGHQRLKHLLAREGVELQEFSELLLRMLGEEQASEVEQQFRARRSTSSKGEQRSAEVLLTTLVAMVLRFLITSPADADMSLIIDRYKNIEEYYTQQLPALHTLIYLLRRKVRENALQIEGDATNTRGFSRNSGQVLANNILASDSLATWSQMLWEYKDDELDQTLRQEGILSRLMEDGYDPRAVLRHLRAHTNPAALNIPAGQIGTLQLLVAPSPQGRQFRQNLGLPGQVFIDFPDIERLLLLYVQHYTANPLFVPDPPPAALPAPQVGPDNSPSDGAPSAHQNGTGTQDKAVGPLDPSEQGSADPSITVDSNGQNAGQPAVASTSDDQGNNLTVRRTRSQRKSKGAQEPLGEAPIN